MDVAAELAMLQGEVESMMTDRCEITRAGTPTGPRVLDPATGLYPPVPRFPVYAGRCFVKVPAAGTKSKARDSAGDAATLLFGTLAVPVGAPRVLVNDQVNMISSRFNQSMVGIVFSVTDLLPTTRPTKQQVAISVVVD